MSVKIELYYSRSDYEFTSGTTDKISILVCDKQQISPAQKLLC